jgi:type IV pilus assembly protein PilA
MKKLFKKQDGFTLVELLAVIVILAVIAAIAIPAVGHIINSSRQKAEANDALQIIDAAKLYMADGNVDTTSGTVKISPTDLSSYLNGTHSAFSEIVVTIGSSSSDDTYTITGHTDPVASDSTTYSGGDTEANLLMYLGKSSTPTGN